MLPEVAISFETQAPGIFGGIQLFAVVAPRPSVSRSHSHKSLKKNVNYLIGAERKSVIPQGRMQGRKGWVTKGQEHLLGIMDLFPFK